MAVQKNSYEMQLSGTEGLFQLTGYSPLLREVRTGTQAGTCSKNHGGSLLAHSQTHA